ncbi:MAG: ATP synthase F0 subunit B [Myxococcales bacterium]|nr:ATP synthase F0 subunit B [Myxococcales bacterium]
MRVYASMLLALALGTPSVVLAEQAHEESLAHEVTEEQSGQSAHGDHGELSVSALFQNREFQGTLINFAVLVGLLVWVIRKKGNPALAARRAEVEKELAEARRLRTEAEKRHMETAMRLERLDEEMLQIRADMTKAGEAERDRIVEQAEEKAARIRRDANFLIEQQIKQLRKDLMQQASNAAVIAARDLLQDRTSDADQDRLAEAYLDRLDEVLEGRQS